MTRIAVVKKDRCNPHGCGDYLCMRVCPVNRTGAECIMVDNEHNKKIKIAESLCTGCGICPKKCPFEAIYIINLPEQLKEKPINRYGENGFALYGLPTPQFGKVVGLVGRNGIGKSTAIKILAGVIKPNFGRKVEGTYDELIKHFKGTEAQGFFEKVREDKIKASYKPQAVEAIPKQFDGKVEDLLKKVDEKGQFDKIVEKLDLKKILGNKLTEISGGELQRVAIAATVLKKANLYIFDEPTSFLDIKQRIKLSKFIKELADENTAVLIIEHDLIVLDYIADMIHIMYGVEEVYGIVSQLRTVKNGINLYLNGYLKEENIRFRDHEIKFMAKPPASLIKRHPLTNWENIIKKQGHFTLKAESGVLNRHEVVGILGENGIGKTTFAKILAGVEKADEGEILHNVKVSYKPQYIEATEEMTAAVLHDAIKKESLMKGLNLRTLMTKKLNQLSGGELQRVAIASCLSKEADLYLLDEPSAGLDVEQRLLVSSVIKSMMEETGKTALIIDHDILFIDYLSDRLTVFDGEPAVNGLVKGPFSMEQGMNMFLHDLSITMRRDSETQRPRINKPDSQLDRGQKNEGKYYYG